MDDLVDNLLRDIRAGDGGLEADRLRSVVERALFGPDRQPFRIGRYTVLERLGKGGGGIVYAAYDPDLDRRVALKLIQPGRKQRAPELTARLRREALALARLSHPNVTTVYEVGEADGRVFISTEYVDGPTLEQWARTKPRSWTEIRDRYVEAARGLAAAHRGGIVHRDFKPANAVVGLDDRVRVLDFGLAMSDRRGSPSSDSERRGGPQGSDVDLLESGVTGHGVTVGTPAYMAPEQRGRPDVDARADQYSLCMAMYEALYGQRPRNPHRPLEHRPLERPKWDPSRPGPAVPRWLHQALQRGLAFEPDDRYPSMDGLIVALRRDVGRRPRWLFAAATVALVAVGVGVVSASSGDACAAPIAAAAGTWGPIQRGEVEAAFEAVDLPASPQALAHVERSLDAWVERWSTVRREACAAADEGAADSLAVSVCLDAQLQDFEQTVGLLASADRDEVLNAHHTIRTLPLVHACQPGQSPELGQGAAAIDREIARAEAMRAAGRYGPALSVIDGAVGHAETAGAKRALARALVVRGRLLDDSGSIDQAEQALARAVSIAEGAGLDRVAAGGLTELVHVIGTSAARFDEGLRVARLARAKIHRVGDRHLEAKLLNHAGVIHSQAGRHDAAIDSLTQALELREADGADPTAIASVLNNVGTAHLEAGRADMALGYFERALEATTAVVGPDHPEIAPLSGNLATANMRLGRLDAAKAHYERSLDLFTVNFGPSHPRVVATLNNLGTVLRQRGDTAAAMELFERSAKLARESVGPNHPLLGYALSNLAQSHADAGRWSEAEETLASAIAIFETSLGPQHPNSQQLQRQMARFRKKQP